MEKYARNRDSMDMSEPFPFLHVDISRPEWKNKPAEFWDPVVVFVKNMAPDLLPSREFKALLPNAGW